MTQNQHQVSIIGSGSCSLDRKAGVSRSFSSSSNNQQCQEQERTSPEGRSCGDLEQEQGQEEEKEGEEGMDKLEINHCASVHNIKPGLETEDVTSFSSCYKYQTPVSNLSQEDSEYLSPKELFADIGIKYIDCEETDDNNRDDDTSISSFTSTYQTPSSAGSDKMVRDLSKEMKETADLGQVLAKHVDITSLNTSDLSSNIAGNYRKK